MSGPGLPRRSDPEIAVDGLRLETGFRESTHPGDVTTAGLMLRIHQGDGEALELLMKQHWGRVVRYGALLLGSDDEAEDVAQEVFVRVWEHRSRWRPKGSVEGYLYRIARNLILLDLRRRTVRGRTEPEIRSRVAQVRTPIEDAISGELHQALAEALREMPDRRREAFFLVRVDGQALAEAAKVMGLKKQTVANHVYMALSDLEIALRPFLP